MGDASTTPARLRRDRSTAKSNPTLPWFTTCDHHHHEQLQRSVLDQASAHGMTSCRHRCRKPGVPCMGLCQPSRPHSQTSRAQSVCRKAAARSQRRWAPPRSGCCWTRRSAKAAQEGKVKACGGGQRGEGDRACSVCSGPHRTVLPCHRCLRSCQAASNEWTSLWAGGHLTWYSGPSVTLHTAVALALTPGKAKSVTSTCSQQAWARAGQCQGAGGVPVALACCALVIRPRQAFIQPLPARSRQGSACP
jgi:hypothetical protein